MTIMNKCRVVLHTPSQAKFNMKISKYKYNYFLITSFILLSINALAQKGKNDGTVDDEQIVVEKNRKIELPLAPRNFEKIPAPSYDLSKRKIVYDFIERKLAVQTPKFTPPITQPPESAKNIKENVYDNIVQVGVGNYVRKYAEAQLSTRSDAEFVVGGTLKHNSSLVGPVDGDNSANAENRVNVFAKYFGEYFKMNANLSYDREVFRYYGYRPGTSFESDSIKQTLNKIGFGLGIENPNQDAKVDWGLNSKFSYFFDAYKQKEIYVPTKTRFVFPITDNFTALLNADLNISIRTDSLSSNRPLYRVTPTFTYQYSNFLTLTAGLNILSYKDELKKIEKTGLFPIVHIDYALDAFHFFAGFTGDVNHNTLHSLYSQNQWLAPHTDLVNTEKKMEFYIGSKGKIMETFGYDAKISYAKYRNFYVFNNSKLDSTKFVVQYDTGNVSVTSLTGLITYQIENRWNSSLKLNYSIFGMSGLEKAWHTPKLTATFSNSVIFKDKLIVSSDFYLMLGIAGKNLATDKSYDLPAIADLNLKFNYLFSDQFAVFVTVNNIFNKNYQRFLNYHQQGLNSIVGVSYSF